MNDFTEFLSGIGGLLSTFGGPVLGASSLASAYDRLGNIGEAAQQGAQVIGQQGIEQTRFQPFSVRSATGGMFDVDETGNVTMGLSGPEKALQSSLMGGARRFYNQAMQPTAGRESDVYERIRGLQREGEQQQQLNLEERLANQGRLGVRTNMFGGTPEQLALSQAQGQSRNQAALMAMQQAQQEQMQQARLGESMLSSAYVPQAQLLNAQSASQLYPQLAQRGQLAGAGLFGEASMGGLEALLGAGQGQANLMGTLGTAILSGLAKPTDGYGGLMDVISKGGDFFEKLLGPDLIPFTGD